jgi:hypothetical protein
MRNNQKIKFDDSAQEERTGAEENLFIVLLLPLFIFMSKHAGLWNLNSWICELLVPGNLSTENCLKTFDLHYIENGIQINLHVLRSFIDREYRF